MTDTLSIQEGEVVESFMPYYIRMAKNMASRIRCNYHEEDLISIARIALWQELQGYDPSRHFDFGRASLLRVRGAMIDYLRKIGGRSRERNNGARQWRLFYSLDAPIRRWDERDNTHWLDRLSGPDAACARLESCRLPTDWDAVLDEREAFIVHHLYWDEWTMLRISSDLGIHQSRVSQIHADAIRKLHTALDGRVN